MKQGDIVTELDGSRGVVHTVYSETHVSLCLKGYDKYGDMVERDWQTPIEDLTPRNKNIFGKAVGTCRCGGEVYKSKDKDMDYPYYCPDCDENMYSIEVTLYPRKKPTKKYKIKPTKHLECTLQYRRIK